MFPRTLRKKHYETAFSEEKLSNAEKRNQDKTSMKNIIHVFYLILSHTGRSARPYRSSAYCLLAVRNVVKKCAYATGREG
jgi:hypothetical protein